MPYEPDIGSFSGRVTARNFQNRKKTISHCQWVTGSVLSLRMEQSYQHQLTLSSESVAGVEFTGHQHHASSLAVLRPRCNATGSLTGTSGDSRVTHRLPVCLASIVSGQWLQLCQKQMIIYVPAVN